MPIIDELVEGSTARRVWQLKETSVAGVTANLVGTGLTISDVLLTGADGQAVDTTGKFGWSDQANGQVYYDPASGDFQAEKNRYRVRVKVTDGAGTIRYYPETGPIAEIVVRAQRA